MGEPPPLTSIADALRGVARRTGRLPIVAVPLAAARGLTLARPVATDIDYPPFDKAMMDGFAVRAADCRGPGTALRIVGEVAAGQYFTGMVCPGEAVRINTGAPMPAGADAVVMIEHVTLDASGTQLTTAERLRPGENVAPRGADVQAGQVVLEAGQRLGPAQIAAAAAAGAVQLGVYRLPRVAILVTGDELVEPGKCPTGGQIRNCNGPCLVAAAAELGCEVIDLGVVGDSPEALRERIERGLEADILCVTGGMSMGQHDYVPGVLQAAGVELETQKIAIKPGKPAAIGVGPRGQMVFGLPGNPVSAYVCMLVFVRAAVEAMQARPVRAPETIRVRMETALKAAGARAEYIPAVLSTNGDGEWTARPARWTGSGDIFGLARANGLLVRAAHEPATEPGAMLPAVILGRGMGLCV